VTADNNATVVSEPAGGKAEGDDEDLEQDGDKAEEETARDESDDDEEEGKKKEAEEEEEEECAICFVPIVATEIDDVGILGCGHSSFHNTCLDLWVSKCLEKKLMCTCPICRAPVNRKKVVDSSRW